MRKLFTFLCAALMSVGMFALTPKGTDVWDDDTKTLTVNGNPVSNAYIGVSDIENLVISDAVTSIGDNAFENCNGLKSVSFGSSLASIGKEAFASCVKLESVTFPALLESIGKSAFSQCYALTSVTITNGLTSIEQQAFYNCEKLASVTIPNSVASIGMNAFGNCDGLTEIVVAAENPNYSSADGVLFNKDKTTLIQCPGGKQGDYTVPNSVTSIGNNAFASCFLLTSVEIPNSVEEIGVQAFQSCSGLTSVTIGNGVTSIGGYAFYYSSKLASVTINATTPPTLGGSAFDKTAAALKICVPAGSVDTYKAAWTAYADKIEAIPGDEPEPADEYAEIVWTEDVEADHLAENATFALVGTTFSATIADAGNKMVIDANTCRFGTAEDYKSYTHRLKSGGASSSTKNFITLNIPEAGTLRIAPRTGSNSATDRALVITQGGTALYNAVVQELQAIVVTEDEQNVRVYPYVEVPVVAGSVRVSYSGGMNFYSFGFKAASSPTGKPIVVFEANGKKKEVEIESFPHTFSCSYENKNGELDAIIKELYEISAGHCHDDNYPVASGNEAVLAGSNGFDNYITISAAFEGTATVSGWYWNSDAYDGDGDWMTYTLTISIKSSEPAVKYYIVGNMTNWEVNENYEMNPSLEAETEEYFYGLDLTTTSEFKVVKVEGENKTWYPDGMGNNYGQNGEIERDGEYTIYFRPNMDGGEAWFYNCILAVRHTVAERVVMGFLLPENGMPQTGVKLIGSFEAGMLDLYLNSETGWYVHDNVVAVDEDKFYLRDAADAENFLLAFADGEWDIAEFIFDEVWEDDTWKGDPVKWVELDLSDNSKYAWSKAIPDAVDNITADVKAVKFIRNGEVLILKSGKTFNLLGAEVK